MRKKNLLIGVLTATVVLSLAGCGSSNSSSSQGITANAAETDAATQSTDAAADTASSEASTAASTEAVPAATTESTAESTSAESPDDAESVTAELAAAPVYEDGIDPNIDYDALAGQTITVASAPVPHAEELALAKDILASKNIDLEVTEYEDIIQPNELVASGQFYANFFQHIPYLEYYNEENNTNLAAIAGVHIEPNAIYAGKTKSLVDIKDGAEILVANDATNESRALALLQESGLIKLDPNAGFDATQNDIIDNPHNLKIVEVESAQIPLMLNDADFGVIPGNYAVEHGLNILTDSVAVEGASSPYVNIIAVNADNKDSDLSKALAAAIRSKAVRDYIQKNYPDGSVIPVF